MWWSSAAQHHPATLAIAANSATLPGKFQILKHPKGSSYNGDPALREVHLSGNAFDILCLDCFCAFAAAG
jgi:hypothetical protein